MNTKKKTQCNTLTDEAKSERGLIIVGAGQIGKTTLAAAQANLSLLASKQMDLAKKEGFSEKASYRLSAKYTKPVFETEEELNQFLKDTEPIPLQKIPKMPFRRLEDFVDEYIKIYDKISKLSGSQRIYVKNVVHYNLRSGAIILNK